MTDRPTWCVWAMINEEDNSVTAAIYPAASLTDAFWEAHLSGEPLYGDNPEEKTSRSGDDWRPLLVDAVTETARRTGGFISDGGSGAWKRNGKLDKAIVAEANQMLHGLREAQFTDLQQMTQEEKQEIFARWKELCVFAVEAGISEAERGQRTEAACAFAASSPRHRQMVAEYAAREYPNGAPPGPGWTDADRQRVLENLVRPYQRRHN